MEAKNYGVSLEQAFKELDNNFLKLEDHEIYKKVIQDIERPLIEKALQRTFGNQIKAAKILGINRNTLRSKIKKLRIDVDKWKI